MELIYDSSVRRNGVDELCWKHSLWGVFNVRSYYKALQHPITCPFPWKPLWKPKVPTKVSFFIWTVALGKILTVDNLRRRKLVAVDWCCMCKRSGETVDRLLLHCPVAQELWNMVCSLFGVYWIMPCGVVDLLASWSGRNYRFNTKLLWSMIPHCLMWLIWRRGIHVLLKGMKGQFMS